MTTAILSPQTVLSLVTYINDQIPFVRSQLKEGETDRAGGYVYIGEFDPSVRSDDGLRPYAHVRVGETEPNPEEHAFWRNALEKVLRLSYHPEHQTSWESRDPSVRRYGGAIRLNKRLYIGFSGFPERWDEALCFAAALQHSLIENVHALRYAHETTRAPLRLLLMR